MRESRSLGSVGAKAEWLSYPTTASGIAEGSMRDSLSDPKNYPWHDLLAAILKNILSWPTVCLVAILMFHVQVGQFITSLSERDVKYKDLQLAGVRAEHTLTAVLATDQNSETPATAPAATMAATHALQALRTVLPNTTQDVGQTTGYFFVGQYDRSRWTRPTVQFDHTIGPAALQNQTVTVIDAVYVRARAPEMPGYKLGMITGLLQVGDRVVLTDVMPVTYQDQTKVWAKLRKL